MTAEEMTIERLEQLRAYSADEGWGTLRLPYVVAVMRELVAEVDRLRRLVVEADSICSLILYRESRGLSEQTRSDLDHVVTDLRKASQ